MTKIEELLSTAAGDPHAPAWRELFEEACHQGLSDADKALLLPRLADITARFAPVDRDNALILGGQIAADLDEASWSRYAEVLAALHRLTGDWLPMPADSALFIMRLQAVIALEGDELWGAELDRIAHDEIEVECPECGTSLFVVFGEVGCFATHENYATKSDVERTPLLPAAPSELDGVGRRLYSMSAQARTTVRRLGAHVPVRTGHLHAMQQYVSGV